MSATKKCLVGGSRWSVTGWPAQPVKAADLFTLHLPHVCVMGWKVAIQVYICAVGAGPRRLPHCPEPSQECRLKPLDCIGCHFNMAATLLSPAVF